MSVATGTAVRWFGPVLDAGDAARGARVLLRALEAAGHEIQVCQGTAGAPVAATDAERVWLQRCEAAGHPSELTVQRAYVRSLRPVSRGIGIAWIPVVDRYLADDEVARLGHQHGIVVPDVGSARMLHVAGISEERVLVMPEVVDPSVFHPGATRRCLHDRDEPTAVWIDPRPGAMLDALVACFVDDDPVAGRLVLIGSDESLRHAPTSVSGDDPRGPIIAAMVPDDRTRAGLMAGADVVIAGCGDVGYRRLVAEASAVGRTVMGCAANGVDDRTGWLVAPEASASMDSRRKPTIRAVLEAALTGAAARRARERTLTATRVAVEPRDVVDTLLEFARGLPPLRRRPARLGTTRVQVVGPLFGDHPSGERGRGLVDALSDGWELEVTAVETEDDRDLPMPPEDCPLRRALSEPPSGDPHVTIDLTSAPGLSGCGEGPRVLVVDGASLQPGSRPPDGPAEVWVLGDGSVPAHTGPHGDRRLVGVRDALDPAVWNPGVPPIDLHGRTGPTLLCPVGSAPADGVTEAFLRAAPADSGATMVLVRFDPSATTVQMSGRGPVRECVAAWSWLPNLLVAADWALLVQGPPDLAVAVRALACGVPLIVPDAGRVSSLVRPATITAPTIRPLDHEGARVPDAQPVRSEPVDPIEGAIRRALAADAGVRRSLIDQASRIARAATWDVVAPALADRLRMLAVAPTGTGAR